MINNPNVVSSGGGDSQLLQYMAHKGFRQRSRWCICMEAAWIMWMYREIQPI